MASLEPPGPPPRVQEAFAVPEPPGWSVAVTFDQDVAVNTGFVDVWRTEDPFNPSTSWIQTAPNSIIASFASVTEPTELGYVGQGDLAVVGDPGGVALEDFAELGLPFF